MDTLSIICKVAPYQKRNIFKGVFPCDSLPHRFNLPAIFVINLSPHYEAGTHWVAVYISSNRYAFYFDSFGLPIKNRFIQTFLEKNSVHIKHNKMQLQHIISNKCGKYCCVFVITILKNCSISSFVNKFSNNLFINEIVIENLYNYLCKNNK